MSDPFKVVRDFEAALCEYTGAKYAVTTTSCTMAILLALTWHIKINRFIADQRVNMEKPPEVWMPKFSYIGVPASILNAGGKPKFDDVTWLGEYQLFPYPVWDSARRFTSGMFRCSGVYKPGSMQCVSFHVSKILGDSQGGAILHDDDEADAWLRRARFDGRTQGVDAKYDQVTYPSWHASMSPDVAARLLHKLSVLPKHNADLPNSDYPDLSTLKAFQ